MGGSGHQVEAAGQEPLSERLGCQGWPVLIARCSLLPNIVARAQLKHRYCVGTVVLRHHILHLDRHGHVADGLPDLKIASEEAI